MRVQLDLKLIQRELPAFRAEVREGKCDIDRIVRMLDGWSNQYRAHPAYCAAALQEIFSAQPTRVLECGSGFTTLLLTVLAEELKLPFVVLEHVALWADIVRRSLRFLQLPYESVRDAPLSDWGGFEWYAAEALNPADVFDFVVCDGPPGTTRGGRVGLLPALGNKLARGAIVLLDDAERAGEEAVLRHWRSFYHAAVEMRGEERRFAKVTLPA